MKKQTKKPKTLVKIKEPKKDRELPATKRLLDLKIQEVKGDVTSLRLEMKAGFTKVDAKFSEVKSEVTDVKAQLTALNTKITKMMILMEDQNDRNLAANDRNALIYQRIVDNDYRFEKLEEQVFGIKQR
jgi:hypothetical protein